MPLPHVHFLSSGLAGFGGYYSTWIILSALWRAAYRSHWKTCLPKRAASLISLCSWSVAFFASLALHVLLDYWPVVWKGITAMLKGLAVAILAVSLVAAAAPNAGFMYHAGQNLEPGDMVFWLPSYATQYQGELYGMAYKGGCDFTLWAYTGVYQHWEMHLEPGTHTDEWREWPPFVCWNNGLNFGSEAKRLMVYR